MIKVTRQQVKVLKSALGRTKGGFSAGSLRKKEDGLPYTLRMFGCTRCPHAGRPSCPHGIKAGGHHSNWICAWRLQDIKKQLETVHSIPRLIQEEEAIKLKLITDNMVVGYIETGELNPEYKFLNKNLITAIDKMRKQDEGVKISAELTVAHEDFKKMVEIEAKKIEEHNNRTRLGEIVEEVRDNRHEA